MFRVNYIAGTGGERTSVLRAMVTGDSYRRVTVDAGGLVSLGSGAIAPDVTLARTAAGVLTIAGADGAGAAHLAFLDGGNIQAGTSTGTKIGTSSSQKLGFYGTTPVVRPTSTPVAGSDAGTVQTLVNALRTSLLALGLIA